MYNQIRARAGVTKASTTPARFNTPLPPPFPSRHLPAIRKNHTRTLSRSRRAQSTPQTRPGRSKEASPPLRTKNPSPNKPSHPVAFSKRPKQHVKSTQRKRKQKSLTRSRCQKGQNSAQTPTNRTKDSSPGRVAKEPKIAPKLGQVGPVVPRQPAHLRGRLRPRAARQEELLVGAACGVGDGGFGLRVLSVVYMCFWCVVPFVFCRVFYRVLVVRV